MSESVDMAVVEELKSLLGDKFSQFVSIYIEHAENYLEAIKKALESEDLEAVGDAAHPLKSSSGSIGLKNLMQSSKYMEALAKDSQDNAAALDKIKPLYEKACEEFEQGKEALRGACS